ncbi:MAG: GNAT family N-acetyltransferase [Thermonemataceae bacterium]
MDNEIEECAWDSDFFGYKVGKAFLWKNSSLPALLQSASAAAYRLVYLYTTPQTQLQSPPPVTSLVRVARQIQYVYALQALADTPSSHPSIQLYTAKEANQALIALSLSSGMYSRFKKDTNFPEGTFERLYTHWIEQAVRTQTVFVYKQEEAIKGLLTLKLTRDKAIIDLLAVHQTARNQGVATQLILKAFQETYRQGYAQIHVTTQAANVAACRLYEKVGFRVAKETAIYHLWL